MSVIELGKTDKHVPDPFVIVPQEPDPRLDRLHKGVERFQEHTTDLEKTWRITQSRIREEALKGDSSIESLSKVHDASRKLWTILGMTFVILATVNLIKGGTTVWRWFKRIRSDWGDDQEQSNKRPQNPRRIHSRSWAIGN